MKKTLQEEKERILQIIKVINEYEEPMDFDSEKYDRISKDSPSDWPQSNKDDYEDDEYFEKPKQPHGIGKFENIDWKVLFDTLIDNYDVGSGSISDSFGANYGDLTDHDGMLSPEELQHLEDFGLVERMDSFPVVSMEYRDFNTFYKKAKEIWNKESPSSEQSAKGDSETPYLRGREPES